ncbi:hypothetical protein BH10ACI3_BH10ACI3_16760 [soil metagenome]
MPFVIKSSLWRFSSLLLRRERETQSLPLPVLTGCDDCYLRIVAGGIRLKSTMSLNETIVADLTAAMKAKDADKVSTLRMVKANLMNRKIEKGGELTDDEILKALQSLVKQRRDSIEIYEKAGRSDLAAKESAEIGFIDVYMPRAATADEINAAVAAAVAETGATSMKDMGTVMKAAMANLAGKTADGRMVSEAVKASLS